MTLFMAFAILGSFATIALLWCFMGFSRELKQGRKTVGVVVRVSGHRRETCCSESTERKQRKRDRNAAVAAATFASGCQSGHAGFQGIG